MRTFSRVHTPEERLAQRRTAQLCAWRSLWRVAACASILRTAVTRLLPLCGAAAWWMTAACLAPGLVCYGLCCLALRLTRTQSLPECARLLLGRAGETVLLLLCGAAVAMDGVSSMTALVTLFTQGIGARGTQLTMAVLTGLLLLPCLQRDGLIFGVRFLSRLMLALLGLALLCRMLGVALCLLRTPLRPKERLFCMIAYLPKATVQAAIGGVPLAMGLACGQLVLTGAVAEILLTAPLGAIGMACTYRRLLTQETPA